MSVFDGLSRPMRAAGLGLLAVAVIAAVIGGITLATGNGDGDDTAAPTTSESAQPSSPGPGGTSRQQPTTRTSPPASESPSGSATATPKPSTPTTGPGRGNGDNGDNGDGDGANGQDQQASVKSVGVRVYNNSTIKGLAHDAADDLRAQGWNVVEVGNYSSGIIPTTTAYFRPGTGEEAAAKALAAEFGMRAEPRFQGIKDSSAGVIVIVTKDYGGADQGK